MQIVRLFATSALAVAICAVASCRVVAGIDDRAPAKNTCAACVDARCSTETTACHANPYCATRSSCLASCDLEDARCRAACVATRSAASSDEIAALESCRTTSCASQCAPQCGDTPLLVPAAAADACAACVTHQCCDKASACAANVACVSILECLDTHSTPDGWSACTDVRYPSGVASYVDLNGCLETGCIDECAVGNDWSCLGRVAFPAAPSDTITQKLKVVDSLDQTKTLTGLQAVVCSATDVQCVHPSAPFTFDAAGIAIVVVQTTTTTSGRVGFDGFVLITDPTYSAANPKSYKPSFLYAFPALTESGVTRTLIMSSNDSVATASSFVGVTIDPTRGILVVSAIDCVGRRSPNVSFTVSTADAETRVVYAKGAFLDRNATSTGRLGGAIIVNVPPGQFTLTAIANDTGQRTSVTPGYARADALSLVLAVPTP